MHGKPYNRPWWRGHVSAVGVAVRVKLRCAWREGVPDGAGGAANLAQSKEMEATQGEAGWTFNDVVVEAKLQIGVRPRLNQHGVGIVG